MADRARPVRELIGRNKPFAWALTAGAVLRLLAVLGYPGALWFYGDSYIYLGAALRPQPDPSKTTGYSLFLRALLPLHSLTLVVVLQHLMGLADAVLIYALLRRAGVSKRWATIASLPMLLDGYVIEDEHLIMTEALFTFLLMLSMTLVLWRPRVSAWKALIAGLLIGFAAIVRTEGAVVLIIFPLFLLVRGWSWKTVSGWVAAVAMCAGIAVPVGGYVSWFHSRNGQYELTTSAGLFLWGRVSSFADCARIKPTGAQARVCPTQAIRYRRPPGNYIYHAPQVTKLPGGATSPQNNSLLTSFAIHAIEAQPLDYAQTVVKGTLLSFGFPRIAYPRSGTTFYYSFHAHYKTATYDTLPPGGTATTQNTWIAGGTAYGDWMTYGRQQPGVVSEVFAYPLIAYSRVIYTWGPLLAVIFLLGLGGVIGLRRRGSARRMRDPRQLRLRWQVRGTSMLPWITAVALLVTPIAVADFDYRYLIPALPFACAAAGLAFAPASPRGGHDPLGEGASGGAAEQAIGGSVAR
ncbi:MAG TPA: phospholipid carrier-dependent glycosyltransferase [Trebonia sp.]|nr:phospholipid carrier-dependent glycosyltransferase [Trebonia sp.]